MDYSHTNTATTTATASPLRPGSAYSGDHPVDDITPLPRPNPFATPYSSQPASTFGSSAALHQQGLHQRYFKSRRVKQGEVEKPWLSNKDPREKWVTIIPIIGIVIGLGIAGFLVWDGLRTVVSHTYCPVLDEDWSSGFDSKIWTKEVEVGGFG